MKLLVYTDNHWCQYSSIFRRQGEKYSCRLENQIKSVNWAENIADQLQCSMIIHCGDFFDKESLNSQELTALNDIDWSKLPHIFLTGNHELGSKNADYSSSHLFNLISNVTVISKPTWYEYNFDTKDADIQLCFLPYILPSDQKNIQSYFPDSYNKRIIFSHNDISGIQLGQFISTDGFKIEDIQSCCDLFINGHIHNGQKVADKVFNIGNLTGQNFSEDAQKYQHGVFVVDTDTLRIDFYQNPYALNFYKLDLCTDSIDILDTIVNGVVTIKCFQCDVDKVKQKLEILSDSILESRLIISQDISTNTESTNSIDLSVDHLAEFRKFILSELGSTDVILKELEEILS